jgi:hypothetical protein
MTPSWHPLIVRGAFNDAIKRQAEHASGAYAIREKGSHRVVYVGSSHSGRLWKTMLRHFHAAKSFREVREGFVTEKPDDYDVAIAVTSHGKRARHKSGRDERALAQEVAWIKSLRPSTNVTGGEERITLAGESDDPWGGLLNPAGAMHKLGVLVRITYLDHTGRERALRFSVRRGPQCVYDARGRLYLAYVSGRAVREATPEEVAEYKKVHWGQRGKGDVYAGAVALPPFKRLGPSVTITYAAAKGSSDLKDWIHPWGEGGRGRFTPPMVLVHSCQKGPKCAGHGRVCLHGGTYRVTERGIVG